MLQARKERGVGVAPRRTNTLTKKHKDRTESATKERRTTKRRGKRKTKKKRKRSKKDGKNRKTAKVSGRYYVDYLGLNTGNAS